jgi:hypothetical protein
MPRAGLDVNTPAAAPLGAFQKATRIARNVPECPVYPPSTIPPQRAESFQRHMAAYMKKQTGKTLQEAARAAGIAKSSVLQFRWLDAPRSMGTARTGQAPGFESPVAAGTKTDALEHGGRGATRFCNRCYSGRF